MSSRARTRFAIAGLAATTAVVAAAALTPGGALESGVDVENPGLVCAPLNKNGVASFSHEYVANRSDAAVEVTRVEVVDVAARKGGEIGDLVVDEWFLTAEDWPGGSVGRGPLADPGTDRLSTTVQPGEQPMLNVAVRAPDGIGSQHSMRLRVLYLQKGRRSEAATTLNWILEVAPTGRPCR